MSGDDNRPTDPNRSDGPSGESAGPHRPSTDRVARAAQRALLRERAAREEPEPSLGVRLGQIGILGWTIVLPTLLGLALGHWLDRYFGTGVFFSAPLLMVGAGVGLWSAWKWMHRQTRRK
ncbi:F0F1-ATPase subunit family protein [Paraburkholderia fungorum]|uniref:F0F1-ATPase subunit family protein n=1 Tax=Paraburkholderia fungorum TaxID=134537 RepID=A0AAU8T0B1_9BURK|nr:AtpZ/AtpI family protein [Paraburkholderia fungorum]AJZ57097.1 F0F1-ATPase subunit family protein [Paraburkholderia fungorum]